MRYRWRPILLLAAVSITSQADAVTSAPTVRNVPAFLQNLAAITADAPSGFVPTGCVGAEAEFTESSTGQVAVVSSYNMPDNGSGDGWIRALGDLSSASGHQYSVRIRAWEVPAPPGSLSTWCSRTRLLITRPADAIVGEWSSSFSASFDSTSPEAGLVIASGRAFTRSRIVGLSVVARDVVPAGGTLASGVASVLVHGDALSSSPAVRDQVRLTGPDGNKTVGVSVVDNVGLSAEASDTIVLDTHGPVIRLSRASRRVPVGALASLDASTSFDRTAGIRPGSFFWRFGDGLPGAVGPTGHHVYRRPGLYRGSVRLLDRAGNVSLRRFTVRVTR